MSGGFVLDLTKKRRAIRCIGSKTKLATIDGQASFEDWSRRMVAWKSQTMVGGTLIEGGVQFDGADEVTLLMNEIIDTMDKMGKRSANTASARNPVTQGTHIIPSYRGFGIEIDEDQCSSENLAALLSETMWAAHQENLVSDRMTVAFKGNNKPPGKVLQVINAGKMAKMRRGRLARRV
ncbi:hypothetical protein AMATHDRAFT_6967 [Amanita thiersii Skay4041]|uniref:Uncharacterized protein n=1 Tax=Amanita thiersii Skay4041 TaxID=703135 RepID=A0A2A9ND57_9AGAR|nr:hypothetical protein AMATHDRAFT_6967 [Amanita thiersii Skay4041]